MRIFPYDKLLAVGTTTQIDALRAMLSQSDAQPTPLTEQGFEVIPVTLSEDSFLCGKVLHEVNMRQYRCMVISVLHDGEFITNPKPDYRFGAGDIVWIAGETGALPYSL